MSDCKSKPNSCVGDVDELQIECWNCSHDWIIFRFAAEKEMSAKCPQCGMWNKKALRDALRDTEIIEGYLKSRQFREKYANIKEVSERIERHKQALISNMKTAGYELTKEKDYIEGLVMAQNLILTNKEQSP